MARQQICIVLATTLVTGTIGTTICRADDPSPDQQVQAAKSIVQNEETERQASAKAFRDSFEKAKNLSVRERLKEAANATTELTALAKSATADQLARAGYASSSRTAIYPQTSHLLQLLAERPWLREMLAEDSASYQLRLDTMDLKWPTDQDGPALRQLIRDSDPDIRALAIEALATLHDPADVDEIGGLLRVDVPVVSVLGPQTRRISVSSISFPRAPREKDPLCLEHYWQTGTIDLYARRALFHMTGVELTAETFRDWLKKYRADRNSLWYWQQRLQRQFDQLDLSMARLPYRDHAKLSADYKAKRVELRDAIRRELAALDPQVEARIVLLATHRHAGGADVTNPDRRFIDPPWQTRLSRMELLQLLEGKQPWTDVDWTDRDSGSGDLYDRLASRIMLNADRSFTRDDVPRLQALLKSPPHSLMWSGRTAWLIGISRLLPVAKTDELDDPDTRDGYLRKSVREESDVFVRGYVARELVRVGLPANAPFLSDKFFTEKETRGTPDVRGSILEELGQSPLTAEKRTLLLELVSDKRTRPLLTQPSKRMGDDMYRYWAAGAINAHAGKELMTSMDLQDMRDPSKTNDVLDRVLKQFQELTEPK